MLFYFSSRFTQTANAAVFLGRNNVRVFHSARFVVVLLFLFVNFSFVATPNFFFTRHILAMHLTESNKIIFICSVDLVCGAGISGHESSSLLAVSHPFTRTYTKLYLNLKK